MSEANPGRTALLIGQNAGIPSEMHPAYRSLILLLSHLRS
jgi:hypothetical protein